MAQVDTDKIRKQASQIFTPGSPIQTPSLFAGRDSLIDNLKEQMDANAKKHVVLYGARGCGKTSFCNILLHGKHTLRHDCSNEDDFVTVFLHLLTKLGQHFTDTERRQLADLGYDLGPQNVVVLKAKIEEEETKGPVEKQKLNLNFVLGKLRTMTKSVDAIILDEFQNIQNTSAQAGIIELCKSITDDPNVPIRIVIVGVAGSDTELLTPAEYLEYKGRHFLSAFIPLMTLEDLKKIIEQREKTFNLKFEESQKLYMADIAAGYPEFVHKLALLATFSWISRNAGQLAMGALRAIAAAFGFKVGKIQKLNVSIAGQDITNAILKIVEEFRMEFPKPWSQLSALYGVHGMDSFNQIVRCLHAHEGAGAHKGLAQAFGCEEAGVMPVLKQKAGLLVGVTADGRWKLARYQFAPYLKAIEYLAKEARESLVSLVTRDQGIVGGLLEDKLLTSEVERS
jgi:ATPase domain predominantly from Archaea